MRPTRALVLGYLAYIVVGWLLLCLPVCWESDAISVLDNLFMATSGVSTTGLVTVNTPVAYSFWGELVILCLFQVGGLGYMTLGSFVILSRGHSLPRERKTLTSTAFSLPDGFDAGQFLWRAVVFAFTFEALGALGLWAAFRSAGLENAVWPAIFHAVSAFCTAGFSVFPDSLEQFQDNFYVNAIVSLLSLGGALGFLVVSDVWNVIAGKADKLCLTTKIILRFTFGSILGFAVILFLIEPSLAELPPAARLLGAWFQAMTSLTTVGFNTMPIGGFGAAATMVLIASMLIGASPSGTGGGIKSTSISAAIATVRSTIRGDNDPRFFGAHVPNSRLFSAFSAIAFYLVCFAIGSTLLLLTESGAFEDLIFEAGSALGTVGLSRGVTGDLTSLGKLVIIGMMFLGRTGPITFAVAMASNVDRDESVSGRDDLAI
ncbi:MAG: potassium transporter TrkG [Planctomycetota bacterium]